MSIATEQALSREEQDILQELMNIAFGRASADLAEVIDTYVVLNVPEVRTLKVVDLPEFISTEISDHDIISIVEQSYLGRFKGVALLIFPSGAGRELLKLFGDNVEDYGEDVSMAALEKESILEVSNILIGACVGKVVELLDDEVSFSPPRIIIEDHPRNAIPCEIFEPDSLATVMRTVFQFSDRNISGYLFLINSNESFQWLKKALNRFMEQYE
ncbi:MAG: chemotaxis protein CheC [Proteobacteria bacterium]|nr:chemotaxis protein CheC [Pseudomonadota bacterium]MBU4327124.1 chemotaxis protein CheC [Pseudomonadota bacterium]